MQTITVLLIILAAIVALGLVVFQYYFKSKKRGKLYVLLSFLRFLGVFGLLILLINPKFSKNEYSIEKTNLVVLTDNSSSVASSKNSIDGILNSINTNTSLTDKFKIEQYNFGNSLKQNDSLGFQEKNTNISKALKTIEEVYGNTNSTIVMLSDGNSTIGEDYVFSASDSKFPVYPIAVGDTTTYEDIRINQLNNNKYAFLKNKYPLEIYVSYDGNREVSSRLTISVNGKNVHRENLKLSNTNNSKSISTLIDANTVGIKNVKVSLSSLQNERNAQNNTRNAVVEVIDEKTNVGIISSILHPDIGALRKSIESNEQRSVSIIKPTVNLEELDEVDIFILYQPNQSFGPVYNYLKQNKASVFTIAGSKTNWSTVNNSKRNYRIEDGFPIQEVFGVSNPSFTKFDISDFSLEDFPPLESNAGPIAVPSEGETMIQMKIQGKLMQSPLLYAHERNDYREVLLFGENIWKWRMQSFRNQQNFQNFDEFIGKLMLYLSSNKGKNRLEIDYESVYEGSTDAKIKASYFDEAFVFDSNAALSLILKNSADASSQEIPMLLKNNFYEVDLTDISPGKYSFTVKVAKENRSRTGNFSILEFDVEKQFLSSNYKKLNQLAMASNGKLYFPDKTDSLIQNLANDNRFVPTQKGTKNIVSLIDFRVLLAIIVAALAAEWFIRKYNGLI